MNPSSLLLIRALCKCFLEKHLFFVEMHRGEKEPLHKKCSGR